MKTLEEVLCNNKLVKEGLLLEPALKCVSNPENGIQANKPAALAVIKDCASITVKYLPFYVISFFPNLFTHYKDKLTIPQIKDFCERAEKDPVTHQLKVVLLSEASKIYNISEQVNYNAEIDPYGDFNDNNVVLQKHHNDVYILSKAFGLI